VPASAAVLYSPQHPATTSLSGLWSALRSDRGSPRDLAGDGPWTVVDTPIRRTLHRLDPGLIGALAGGESAVDPAAEASSPHRSGPCYDDDE
jgi:hypothetical protein